MGKDQRLSVIIPAYNQHELTAIHVRESLRSMRVPDEIIVVNDAGPESLRDLLVVMKPFPIRVVYARVQQDIPWNYNGACNLGFWLSTGNIITLEDTDHIPDREAYVRGLGILANRPEIDRIHYTRKPTTLDEVLQLPMDQWKHEKTWGPNQMVSMFRREVYLRAKGQDERFCGAYGWMAYDWVYKYKKMMQIRSYPSEYFYIVLGGSEPNMNRSMSSHNRRVYRENVAREQLQSPEGILNFTYTYEVL